jgi:hypothetical protein
MFGSSGLNLAYEGLLLGTWDVLPRVAGPSPKSRLSTPLPLIMQEGPVSPKDEARV